MTEMTKRLKRWFYWECKFIPFELRRVIVGEWRGPVVRLLIRLAKRIDKAAYMNFR